MFLELVTWRPRMCFFRAGPCCRLTASPSLLELSSAPGRGGHGPFAFVWAWELVPVWAVIGSTALNESLVFSFVFLNPQLRVFFP